MAVLFTMLSLSPDLPSLSSTQVVSKFKVDERAVVYEGGCLELLHDVPDDSVSLVVTSPPYNIGKSYERRKSLTQYVEFQKAVITECCRVLKPGGSICWQVGNYVDEGRIVPLDYLLFPVFDKIGLFGE